MDDCCSKGNLNNFKIEVNQILGRLFSQYYNITEMNDEAQPTTTNISLDDRITGNGVYRDSWRQVGTSSRGDESPSIVLD